MTENRENAIQYAHDNQDRFLDELVELVKIPSVSTDPEHKADMRAAAQWVADKLNAIGMEHIEIMETGGHPVVYGDYLKAGAEKPTVVIYGHYDVQPGDPLDLWKTGPFEPEIKDGKLFARGASDMKGQVMASIHAVDAAMQNGGLVVNVKFMIEGEEEVGSPNLGKFIQKHTDKFSGDVALNPDGGILGVELPTITYALRGLAYFEIVMEGPSHDLHSGMYGGTVLNPANELTRLLGGMIDENGRITLPDFYKRVRELSDEERGQLARLPMDEAFYREQTGSPALHGEQGYTPVEHAGGRPTLDVNGMLSGFTGEGSKTVLPAKAMAKVSMRLVPDQDPKEIYQGLVKYLTDNAREGVTWKVIEHASSPPSITPRDSDGVRALAEAMRTVWGKEPLYRREGGTIPVVAQMQEYLGIDSVLTGFGLPDDNLHAPNEKLSLEPWYRGIDTLIHFFYNLAD
jgi:acetylornithine deacetylase/succinyl-diaminopimelate desuccinylase-like protein